MSICNAIFPTNSSIFKTFAVIYEVYSMKIAKCEIPCWKLVGSAVGFFSAQLKIQITDALHKLIHTIINKLKKNVSSGAGFLLSFWCSISTVSFYAHFEWCFYIVLFLFMFDTISFAYLFLLPMLLYVAMYLMLVVCFRYFFFSTFPDQFRYNCNLFASHVCKTKQKLIWIIK